MKLWYPFLKNRCPTCNDTHVWKAKHTCLEMMNHAKEQQLYFEADSMKVLLSTFENDLPVNSEWICHAKHSLFVASVVLICEIQHAVAPLTLRQTLRSYEKKKPKTVDACVSPPISRGAAHQCQFVFVDAAYAAVLRCTTVITMFKLDNWEELWPLFPERMQKLDRLFSTDLPKCEENIKWSLAGIRLNSN